MMTKHMTIIVNGFKIMFYNCTLMTMTFHSWLDDHAAAGRAYRPRPNTFATLYKQSIQQTIMRL